MTPLQFEAAHAAAWQELEAALGELPTKKRDNAPADRARIAALYRAACEHLAVAEARSYPVWLIERLETLTARGHQRIYRETDFGLDKLARLFLVDFPAAVRAHRLHVLVALIAFAGPLVVTGALAYLDPGFVLSLHDAGSVDLFERMYGDADGPIGRRSAESDWQMFGFYIFNNIRIAFQCFAGGLFFGIGSLFFLALNGALAGSIAGYVTWRGFGGNFYSFVVTHGAFELTGIVLAGAAGLALGHALLAPGRRSRLAALVDAARSAIVIVYGMTAMFAIAAALEAFWSSARWVPQTMKFGVGAGCWIVVVAYFVFQGRSRKLAAPER
ncbi:MAG TPA: stage II sporulation protein M [Caldimonas sp.]|jgi:uncharacterized membrane protein SpoIIM required for sporulation|nr:stage II sporulation protein M [Caldimonas sp.]HEX4234338.1 stage II sporulation protein M [Caldimonas sp.]